MSQTLADAHGVTNNLRWLYLGRGFRSFITAFLTVAFPLYLAVSGYSAAEIGLALGISGFVTVALVALVGLAGDRYGRRNVMLGLALLSLLGCVSMVISVAFLPVVLASGLGGVGKGGGAGSGGSWGPVFPAEQPLVADSVGPTGRTRAFGVLSFVGVIAGAGGSLVAALPALLHDDGWTWAGSYHVLFVLAAFLSLVMFAVMVPIREQRDTTPAAASSPDATPSQPISTKKLLSRLGLTNALNGLGFGFLGPLLTYWFYRRFGVGPAQLGVLYTVVNLASAFPYLWSSRLTARLGAVRTVTVTRAISVLIMLLMAFTPSFLVAGLLFTVRMVFNSLGMPARQSFVMGVSDRRYRSRISAFSQLPSQLTAMISPVIGGALLDAVIDIPIFGASFFMGCNLVAYYFAFRNTRPPEEESRGGPHRTQAPAPGS
ncbi:MAG: MFS transporter [Firmicutes bacterium]|nr:MFS transporter [Bacillota bacterium]